MSKTALSYGSSDVADRLDDFQSTRDCTLARDSWLYGVSGTFGYRWLGESLGSRDVRQ
jgi:hypothetical protein